MGQKACTKEGEQIMFGTDIIARPMPSIKGGLQALIDFEVYQLSIVQHSGSYGGNHGLWEIGVFQGNDMCELPPITVEGDTVRGYLTEDDVADIIVQMVELTGFDPKEIVE